MSEFDSKLSQALEVVYATFSRYPAPTKLEGSPYKDVSGIERALRSAPLRTLSGDQIGPYAGSAILTVGNVSDYKHYLPRIFEHAVYCSSAHIGTDPPIIAERLKRAGWRSWPNSEQVALLAAFTAAWSWSVEQSPSGLASAEDWLCGIAALEEPVEPLLLDWSMRPSMEALLQSAGLCASSASIASNSDSEGAYWNFVSPTVRKLVADWATGPERVAAFLRGQATVPEDDRWYIEKALEEAGYRQLH